MAWQEDPSRELTDPEPSLASRALLGLLRVAAIPLLLVAIGLAAVLHLVFFLFHLVFSFRWPQRHPGRAYDRP